jgi:hypothetical protein
MNKDNVAEKWEEKLEKVLYVGFGAFGITGGMNNGHTTESMIAIRDKTIEDVVSLFTSHRLSLKEELMKKLPKECEFDCKEIINQVLKEK